MPVNEPTTTTSDGQPKRTGKKPKPLTKDEFYSRIRRIRDDARSWIDTELANEQEVYWRYYNGKCDLPFETNRSGFVMTEVRDGVEAALVSINRIMLTASTPVEFQPAGPDDVDLAQQQTDTSHHVFFRENLGFEFIQDLFRDALVADYGVLKTFWDKSTSVEETDYEGLSEQELQVLASDPDVEILEVENAEQFLEGQQNQEPTINVKAKYTKRGGFVRIDAIPTEEFIIDRWALHPDDPETIVVGQDGVRRTQDVVNEGLGTWGDIARSQQTTGTTNMQSVRSARTQYQPFGTTHWTDSNAEGTSSTSDKATEFIRVSELYIRIDKNRDGQPVLYRCIMFGDTVIETEPWDRQPYSLGSPFRRPHAALGFGYGRLLKDVQDLSTALMRASLDSVYSAVNPQKLATKGAHRGDVLANRFGGVIRVREATDVVALETPFVGDSAMAMLEFVEKMKEGRTGISKASMGLDPDALQSSTEFGVVSTISAAQAKIETVARSLIEGALAPCFRKIAQLLAEHQDKPKTFRMRGNFIQVDPRNWANVLDTEPMVGIGRGTQLEKTQTLGGIIQKQEQILQTSDDPNNELVNIGHYSRALNDFLHVQGVKETGRYLYTPQETQQISQQKAQEAAQNPPQPPPEVQIEMAKLEIDKQKAALDMKVKQEQADLDMKVKAFQAEQQMKIEQEETTQALKIDQAKTQNEIELERIKLENDIQLEEVKQAHAMALNEVELDAEIELEKRRMRETPNDPKANANVNRTSNGSKS